MINGSSEHASQEGRKGANGIQGPRSKSILNHQTFDLKQYKFADGPEDVAVINTGIKEGAADLSRDSQRGAEPKTIEGLDIQKSYKVWSLIRS